MEAQKRKTKTSSAVKARYNKKNYCPIVAYVPIEKATAFKAKCAERGISQAQVVKKAIDDFLVE